MSNHFALSDIRDPVAFLTGARIPLALNAPMATWERYEWASDRLLSRLCSDGVWIERHDQINWGRFLLDLSDPDIARWCDRKIAHHPGTSTGHPELTIYRGDSGDPWRGWTCGMRLGWTSANNACSWPAGTWTGTEWNPEQQQYLKPPFDCPALAAIPCDEANLPAARAAILRALFGVNR
jgi:hypothetical protein